MSYGHLEAIKNMLGISGAYQDAALNGYVGEVIAYMTGAGVSKKTAESEEAVGVVARGVADLWNLGSGGTELSDYFKERVTQMAYGEDDKEDPG